MHTLLLMWLSDFCDLLGFPTATVIWGALRNVHADKKYPVHQSASTVYQLFSYPPPPPKKSLLNAVFPELLW